MHGFAVVLILQPDANGHGVVIGVDRLYLVDLLLGKRQRLQESVGYRVVVRQILVDDRGRSST